MKVYCNYNDFSQDHRLIKKTIDRKYHNIFQGKIVDLKMQL